MTIKDFKVLDKLPSTIIPFGLGDRSYPSHWMNEKGGKTIMNLNKFYGETTGMYWLWKNYFEKTNDDEWIGFCQYRRLWLNGLYNKKHQLHSKSLYTNLLKSNKDMKNSCDAFLLQPTIFSNQNLIEQFDTLYGKKIIIECANLLDDKDKDDFKSFLEGNKFSICNMFITKPRIFSQYCEEMFNWIEKCFNYCNKHNLLIGENMRLPVFMVERYTSFWFEKYTKVNYLSFARLGNFFLSDKINRIINPLKLPFTFKMYPTIHRY